MGTARSKREENTIQELLEFAGVPQEVINEFGTADDAGHPALKQAVKAKADAERDEALRAQQAGGTEQPKDYAEDEEDDDWMMKGGEDGLGPDGDSRHDRDMSDYEPRGDGYEDEEDNDPYDGIDLEREKREEDARDIDMEMRAARQEMEGGEEDEEGWSLSSREHRNQDFTPAINPRTKKPYTQEEFKSLTKKQAEEECEMTYENEEEDWNEDYATDTGASATCPKCGSDDVSGNMGEAGKAKIMAQYHECEGCGHRSQWQGPDAGMAQKKYGDPNESESEEHSFDFAAAVKEARKNIEEAARKCPCGYMKSTCKCPADCKCGCNRK